MLKQKKGMIKDILIDYEMNQTNCEYSHAEKKVYHFLESKKKPQQKKKYNFLLNNVFNKKISNLYTAK